MCIKRVSVERCLLQPPPRADIIPYRFYPDSLTFLGISDIEAP